MPEENQEVDWIACLPFEGPERLLPLGVIISTPGIFIEDLIKEVKRLPNGKPYDVILDEDSIKALSGEDGLGILIEDATGLGHQTRLQFYETHGKRDGLKNWALRKIYRKEQGGGVHIQKL